MTNFNIHSNIETMESISVAILMCTKNGEKFLLEQFESILKQTHKNWVLYISDDGSTDLTLKMCKELSERFPSSVNLVNGPQEGIFNNFMSLLRNSDISHDFYCFCDQDDVWMENKLEIALKKLMHYDINLPILYGGRTIYIDSNGFTIGKSKLFNKGASFKNALVQCIAGGNTFVFNNQARKLLANTSRRANLVSHDWWAYILVTAVGGVFIYDDIPTIYYRIHANNQIGENKSLPAFYVRAKKLLSGSYKNWISANLRELDRFNDQISPVNLHVLQKFNMMRHSALFLRIYFYNTTGVYRQSTLGNVFLFSAVVFNLV